MAWNKSRRLFAACLCAAKQRWLRLLCPDCGIWMFCWGDTHAGCAGAPAQALVGHPPDNAVDSCLFGEDRGFPMISF